MQRVSRDLQDVSPAMSGVNLTHSKNANRTSGKGKQVTTISHGEKGHCVQGGGKTSIAHTPRSRIKSATCGGAILLDTPLSQHGCNNKNSNTMYNVTAAGLATGCEIVNLCDVFPLRCTESVLPNQISTPFVVCKSVLKSTL